MNIERLNALIRNPDCPDSIVWAFISDEEIDVPNVYLVVGSVGSYSDYHEWTVGAYLLEEQANTVREHYNLLVTQLIVECGLPPPLLRSTQQNYDDWRADADKVVLKYKTIDKHMSYYEQPE